MRNYNFCKLYRVTFAIFQQLRSSNYDVAFNPQALHTFSVLFVFTNFVVLFFMHLYQSKQHDILFLIKT